MFRFSDYVAAIGTICRAILSQRQLGFPNLFGEPARPGAVLRVVLVKACLERAEAGHVTQAGVPFRVGEDAVGHGPPHAVPTPSVLHFVDGVVAILIATDGQTDHVAA
jgi:hypothetical protein